MSYDSEGITAGQFEEPPRPTGGERAKLPAVFLIVTAVINILIAFGLLFFAVSAFLMPAKAFEAGNQQFEFQKKQMEAAKKEGWTPESMKNLGGGMYLIAGLLALIVSVITLLGAISMLRLRAYGFAMTGAVLALIPCVSPCCLMGIPFGIWGIIALMDPQVKSVFR